MYQFKVMSVLKFFRDFLPVSTFPVFKVMSVLSLFHDFLLFYTDPTRYFNKFKVI